jgi:hypothetical protein
MSDFVHARSALDVSTARALPEVTMPATASDANKALIEVAA